MLEAHGHQYCWNSRVSQYTGLPTVIGWPWHQTQQRNDPGGVRRRANDVATIYNTRSHDTARDLLDKYGVTYVIVGDLERLYYLPDGIAKFDAMVSEGSLSLAYATTAPGFIASSGVDLTVYGTLANVRLLSTIGKNCARGMLT